MNFLKYEAEKKKLQEQNLTPHEYEEEIKRIVEIIGNKSIEELKEVTNE